MFKLHKTRAISMLLMEFLYGSFWSHYWRFVNGWQGTEDYFSWSSTKSLQTIFALTYSISSFHSRTYSHSTWHLIKKCQKRGKCFRGKNFRFFGSVAKFVNGLFKWKIHLATINLSCNKKVGILINFLLFIILIISWHLIYLLFRSYQ